MTSNTEVPEKVTRFLRIAERRNLPVAEVPDPTGLTDIRAWRITASRAIADEVWVYWTPGQRGGRLTFRVFSTLTLKARKVTRFTALAALGGMTT